MNTAASPLLHVSLTLPGRWAVGETRQVELRVQNLCGCDVTDLELRYFWGAQAPAGDEGWRPLAREMQHLPRFGSGHCHLRIAGPLIVGEEALHLDLRGCVGGCMQWQWHSQALKVEVRQRPEGSIKVDVRGHIRGERVVGVGAVSAEPAGLVGGGVGHQVHVHGGQAGADYDNWLRADPLAGCPLALMMQARSRITGSWPSSVSGLDLVAIPAGSFVMGASAGDPLAAEDEKPSRRVRLTRDFWISRHPVTNALWEAVMGQPSPVNAETHPSHLVPRMPVANLTWPQAMEFCTRLTELERAADHLPPGFAYRLPYEMEWEYACRAGCDEPRYGPLEKIGSVQANGGRMMEVGCFQPNDRGVYDMLGLVFEWCLDVHARYRPGVVENPFCWEPVERLDLKRVVRGGCYQGPDVFARASARAGRLPLEASHRLGFRVVLAQQ